MENDERQADYIRKVFSRSIDDPSGYDLVLNLGSIDAESAVRTVVAALRARIPAAARACG